VSNPSTRLPTGRGGATSGRRTAPARHAGPTNDVIEALAKRVSMPLVSEAGTPQRILVAGVPLVAAALVATGNAPASAASTAAAPTSRGLAGTRGAPAAPEPVPMTYRVKQGDTVAHIADRTRLTVRAIIEANHLSPTGLIRPGQVLVLPGVTTPGGRTPQPAAPSRTPAKPRATPTTKPTRPAARRPAAPASAPDLFYVVRAGDTLAGIAERYKLTLQALVQANKIAKPSLIHPGQSLRLPGIKAPARRAAASKPAAPAPTRPYPVKTGDTLIAISEAQKVPLTTILALNHLTTASVIHPGQVLRLPAPPKPKPSVPNTFAGRTYPDAVARAAAANRATLARRKLPSRAQMRAMVQATAKRMGVDPTLALAVAWQESGFNPAVVSPANAIGTMQVIPGTGVWASDLVGRRLDLLVPQDNVTAGVAVLAALLARAEEDDAIAGYYQGLASVRSRGMFEDTKSYVASVQAHRKRFAAELADL